MLVHLVFAFLLAPGSLVAAAAPPESWAPFHGFVGTWKGTRTASQGQVAVTRTYESVVHNQHLLVMERVPSGYSPWGMVSFDDVQGAFVLRRFRPDGSVAELVLKEVSQDRSRVVFSSASVSGGERITQVRNGADEFVETVEAATNGQPLTIVSETVFRRKGR